jgi:hypothetical protein
MADLSSRGIQFAILVRQMRNAQTKYFKVKTSVNLERAKLLEKRVDDIIKTLNLPPDVDPQAKMFY